MDGTPRRRGVLPERVRQIGTVSGLVGLIWQMREDLAFDVGVRHALTNGHAVNEVRAGMTVSFSVLPARSLHR